MSTPPLSSASSPQLSSLASHSSSKQTPHVSSLSASVAAILATPSCAASLSPLKTPSTELPPSPWKIVITNRDARDKPLHSQTHAVAVGALPPTPRIDNKTFLWDQYSRTPFPVSITREPQKTISSSSARADYRFLYHPNTKADFAQIPAYHFNVAPAYLLQYAVELFAPSNTMNADAFLSYCKALSLPQLNALLWSKSQATVQAYFQEQIHKNPQRALVAGIAVQTAARSLACNNTARVIDALKHVIDNFAEGSRVENAVYNRYPNILPLDKTRVHLENGHYINANYGLNKQLILSQAPIVNDRVDERTTFYQMLWEKRSTAIAMLADYVENGHVKCDVYLPPIDGSAVQFGQIQVDAKIVSLTHPLSIGGAKRLAALNISIPKETLTLLGKTGVKLTELTLQRGAETRTVLHFHLPHWANYSGGNAPAVAVLAYHFLYMKTPVIHCSTGCGRAATLAATIGAYRKIKKASDQRILLQSDCISSVVADLRHERVGAVQTAEQYQTIHEALKIMLSLKSI